MNSMESTEGLMLGVCSGRHNRYYNCRTTRPYALLVINIIDMGASMHVVPKYRSSSIESIVLRTLNNLRQQLPVNAEEAMLALQIARFFLFFSVSASLI